MDRSASIISSVVVSIPYELSRKLSQFTVDSRKIDSFGQANQIISILLEHQRKTFFCFFFSCFVSLIVPFFHTLTQFSPVNSTAICRSRPFHGRFAWFEPSPAFFNNERSLQKCAGQSSGSPFHDIPFHSI
jgi:hypothetical protein